MGQVLRTKEFNDEPRDTNIMEKDIEITIDDVIKVNTDEGDTLLVTLPATSANLPYAILDKHLMRVAGLFTETFEGKDVKVLVVPHGMEVQLIKSSQLKDK